MQFKTIFRPMRKVLIVLTTALFWAACGDIPPDSKPPVLTAQINKSPLFDSPQGWGPGFAKAIGRGPGVVVGPGAENPNVFAQQFPARQNEQFKLIARASSPAKPKALGRFQINWLGPEGQFISASIKAFELTQDERTFEHFVVVPAGAVAGMLYVVADGPEDVVRYTEMRLLGKAEPARAR